MIDPGKPMGRDTELIGPVPGSTELLKNDLKNITEISRWLLIPLGIWPIQQEDNIKSKIFQDLAVMICYFLILFLLIPCALHVLLVEKNPQKRMKSVGPMSFCVMAIFKYYFFIMRRKKIRDCLNYIEMDWRKIETPEDRQIMINDGKMGRLIATLSASFMYSGAFFYRTILPFAAPRRLLPDNTTLRPLAYPIYQKLIDTQKTPNYEITFATQWFGGFVVYTISISACAIAATFILHACGQLKIVMSRLNNFVESGSKSPRKLKSQIGEIVELHFHILQFIFQVEEILNGICFIEFIGCTMNLCFLGYYLITELAQDTITPIAIISYSFLIISFTFNIFIYCHIGELLTQQSQNIGTAAYMIDWYRLPASSATDLVLILAMSNYPVNITAGKIVVLSYSTFCNVLKTAMAYFNYLNSMV